MRNKHFHFITAALVSVMLFNTSCQELEDYNQSITLSGQWTGDFGMYYDYEYRGHLLTFDSYDTDIVFYPEFGGATYGYGKQVDFYKQGPYTHIYHYFDWDISRGIVRLRYKSEPSLNCDIYDYRMTSSRFTGYFGGSNSSFSLVKIADYYNWAVYDGWYYCYDRDYWYDGYPFYAKSNVAASDSTTVDHTDATADDTGRIVKYGKRQHHTLNNH